MPEKKPGINTDLVCRKCGHRVGRVILKSRLKWKTLWRMMFIALILELIANTVIYLIFRT